jgi:cytochrome o ubiquinol oxidase subunit II
VKQKIFGVLFFLVAFIGIIGFYASQNTVSLLDTHGFIASEQKKYILLPLALSSIVVIPVLYMLISFALKYRDTGAKRRIDYMPDWDSNKKYEFIWWSVPIIIIAILAVATWKGTHALDPRKPIASDKDALQVQVVSLEWKWLFIYPEQHIATVNYLAIPKDRPVKLTLTSDAPMNSFWVPQLAGQIYTMSGMSTNLYLQADKVGQYRGVSANISGDNFSKMIFTVDSMTDASFNTWLARTATENTPALNQATYAQLTKKSVEEKPLYYRDVEHNLYAMIIEKYRAGHTMNMGSGEEMDHMNMNGMDHDNYGGMQ